MEVIDLDPIQYSDININRQISHIGTIAADNILKERNYGEIHIPFVPRKNGIFSKIGNRFNGNIFKVEDHDYTFKSYFQNHAYCKVINEVRELELTISNDLLSLIYRDKKENYIFSCQCIPGDKRWIPISTSPINAHHLKELWQLSSLAYYKKTKIFPNQYIS